MSDKPTSSNSSYASSSVTVRDKADSDNYLRQRSIDVGSKANVASAVELVHDSGDDQLDDHARSKASVTTGFWRSLAINLVSFSLPAIYLILSKLWIARLDPRFVALTDTFSYLGFIAESLNEGLPKAAWRIIADQHGRQIDERYGLANTMILFQSCLAMILLIATCAGAESFATGFVPADIRTQSALYVRLTSISTTCSVVNAALSTSARALDHPDVPLILALVKTTVNIILDLLVLSPFRPFQSQPTVNVQAIVRACCDVCATLASIAVFIAKQTRAKRRKAQWRADKATASLSALKEIGKVGAWYQAEAIPRTVVSLYGSSLIISLGSQWATAYGVFLTIRVGVGFVPLLAVEASCQTYTGHSWGLIAQKDDTSTPSDLDRHERRRRLKILFRSVAISTLIICLVEIAMYFCVGFGFGRQLSLYLSGSQPVADLAVRIWLLTDWGYIFLAMFFQVSSVLLIAKPAWYCYQSLFATVVFSLPVTLGFWHALDDGKGWIAWFVAVNAGASTFQFFNNLVWTSVYVRDFI